MPNVPDADSRGARSHASVGALVASGVAVAIIALSGPATPPAGRVHLATTSPTAFSGATPAASTADGPRAQSGGSLPTRPSTRGSAETAGRTSRVASTTKTTPAAPPRSPSRPPASDASHVAAKAPVAGPASQIAIQPPVRAIWQWDWDTGIITTAPQSLLAFATAHHVNTIYLQVNPSIGAGTYASFIEGAASAHIRVVATNGTPAWGTQAGQAPLLAFVHWAGTYNATDPSAPFAAINLDIEPYQLSSWSTAQAAVVSQWMANVQAAVAAAGAHALRVSADVPFWLNTIAASGAGESLGLWMAQHTHELVIMAYRSTAAGIVQAATAEIEDGAKVGRPVVVAIDTTASGPTTRLSGQT